MEHAGGFQSVLHPQPCILLPELAFSGWQSLISRSGGLPLIYPSTTRGSFVIRTENRTRMHLPGGGFDGGGVDVVYLSWANYIRTHTAHTTARHMHRRTSRNQNTPPTQAALPVSIPHEQMPYLHGHFTIATIEHPPSAAPAVFVWTNQRPPRGQITINQEYHEMEKHPSGIHWHQCRPHINKHHDL